MQDDEIKESAETEQNTAVPPPRKKHNTNPRLVTGILYVCVLVLFYALKICINAFLFDFLVLAFAVLGTFEMLRAFRDKTTKTQRALVMTFVVLVIVTFSLCDFIYKVVLGVTIESGKSNYTPIITFATFIAGAAIIIGLLVFNYSKVSLESTAYSMLAYIYPLIFLVVLLGANHMEEDSEIAVLFIFTICPFADTFAFAFGKLFGKKLPAKMAPNISPNKTLIGAFGGLVGGAIGSVVVFVLYCCLCKPIMDKWNFTNIVIEWNDIILYIGIGVITSAFSQFGDLVESAIKRKVGIKDMGKILPGHGGILDRIDSSLYATLAVCLIFALRIMLKAV